MSGPGCSHPLSYTSEAATQRAACKGQQWKQRTSKRQCETLKSISYTIHLLNIYQNIHGRFYVCLTECGSWFGLVCITYAFTLNGCCWPMWFFSVCLPFAHNAFRQATIEHAHNKRISENPNKGWSVPQPASEFCQKKEELLDSKHAQNQTDFFSSPSPLSASDFVSERCISKQVVHLVLKPYFNSNYHISPQIGSSLHSSSSVRCFITQLSLIPHLVRCFKSGLFFLLHEILIRVNSQ